MSRKPVQPSLFAEEPEPAPASSAPVPPESSREVTADLVRHALSLRAGRTEPDLDGDFALVSAFLRLPSDLPPKTRELAMLRLQVRRDYHTLREPEPFCNPQEFYRERIARYEARIHELEGASL